MKPEQVLAVQSQSVVRTLFRIDKAPERGFLFYKSR
jgi:hypothetical protein